MEVNSLDHGGPSVRSTAVNLVDRQWLELVARALGRSGIQRKVAAQHLGIDEGLLSAQLAGVPGKHLSFRRMRALPPEFWRELFVLIRDELGVPIEPRSDQARKDAELGQRVREVFALVAS